MATSETVACTCGNALWEITRNEAGSFTVDFRCRCTSCGKEPSLNDLSSRLYYGLVFYGFLPVRQNIWAAMHLTATHFFCGRCFKEDRSKLYDFQTRESAENILEDPHSGWRRVYAFFRVNDRKTIYTVILCETCANMHDLPHWLGQTFRADGEVKIGNKEDLTVLLTALD